MAEKTAPKTNGGDPEEVTKEADPFRMNALILREQRSLFWRLHVPAGTPVKHLERPGMFTIIAGKLNRHDVIECIWSDASRFVELIVLNAGAGSPVVTQIMRDVPLRKVEPRDYDETPAGHRFIQDQTTGLWGALRERDGVMVIRDKPDRKTALRELQDHASLRGH